MAPSVTRRTFLKTGALAAASTAAAGVAGCATGRSHAVKRDEHVLVIGAGMAGLGAAEDLAKQGFDVTVLEARPRVGGRIWTGALGEEPVDLGASWIHGVRGNPITQLARRFDLRMLPTRYGNAAVYETDGARMDPAVAAEMFKHFIRFTQRLYDDADTFAGDVSIRAAADALMDRKGMGPEDRRMAALRLRRLKLYEGDDLDRVSLKGTLEYKRFEGVDLLFPGGYARIPEGLAAGLRVVTRCAVHGVEHSDAGVVVQTTQGDFAGDYAVCTLPLGVLKAGAVEFSPPLPEAKQAAIRRLGMGVYDKCVLRFPRIAWPTDREFLTYAAERDDEYAVFFNQAYYTGAPVLMAIAGGDHARGLEDLGDGAVADRALRVLRIMFGAGLPEPEAVQVTRWWSDPLARGAYSYAAVGASGADRDALAEPVGRLHFAGEATNRVYYSTVHGAYLSGVREAYRITGLLPERVA